MQISTLLYIVLQLTRAAVLDRFSRQSDTAKGFKRIGRSSRFLKDKLTGEKLNPVQRRYSALYDILNRERYTEISTPSTTMTTVFDADDDGSGLGDYDYPRAERKPTYSYHMRGGNAGYGILFTGRG